MIFEIVSYSLSGFFMKISDELMDEKKERLPAIITGVLCVIFTLFACKISSDATGIFLSILIGTALASKVDSINHILSAVLFVAVLLIIGLPHVSLISLILCTFAAFIDEKGNDKSDELESIGKSSDKGFLFTFFKYRYALKLTVFILSLLGLVKLFLGLSLFDVYFNPMTIVYFYAFDLSYEFADLIFEGCYNFF